MRVRGGRRGRDADGEMRRRRGEKKSRFQLSSVMLLPWCLIEAYKIAQVN